MADGQAPDQTQALLQMQSLINSSRGNKPSFGLGVIPMEWNAAGPFDMKGAAPLAKNIAPLISSTGGKQGGIADKFLQAFASMGEDFKKMASSAGVMYSGDLPNGTLPGSAGGSGGSFASNVGPSSSNDVGIG
jgi:hypothetical protein